MKVLLRHVADGLALCFALLIAPPLFAATIDAVAVQPDSGNTRVVFDVSVRVLFQVFTLENPHRVVVDLDEPRVLVRERLRPSVVATRQREVTQPQALALFERGAAGMRWWSTFESLWANVTLFDVRGSVVRQFVFGEVLAPGLHQIQLDGRDQHGNPMRSGVYLYEVSMPGHLMAGKMLFVR